MRKSHELVLVCAILVCIFVLISAIIVHSGNDKGAEERYESFVDISLTFSQVLDGVLDIESFASLSTAEDSFSVSYRNGLMGLLRGLPKEDFELDSSIVRDFEGTAGISGGMAEDIGGSSSGNGESSLSSIRFSDIKFSFGSAEVVLAGRFMHVFAPNYFNKLSLADLVAGKFKVSGYSVSEGRVYSVSFYSERYMTKFSIVYDREIGSVDLRRGY